MRRFAVDTSAGMSAESWASPARWGLALRGFAALVFGFIVWTWPAMSLRILLDVFGIFVIVAGFFAIVAAFTAGHRQHRGALLLDGIVGILAGLVTLGWPAITARSLLFVIGAWAIMTGFVELAGALRVGRTLAQNWLLMLSAVASLVFGALFLALGFAGVTAGVLALLWLLGIYAIVYGLIFLTMAFTGRVPAAQGPAEPRQPPTGAVA